MGKDGFSYVCIEAHSEITLSCCRVKRKNIKYKKQRKKSTVERIVLCDLLSELGIINKQ